MYGNNIPIYQILVKILFFPQAPELDSSAAWAEI